MRFADTRLPELKIFQDAFRAGWARYVLRFAGDTAAASAAYLSGPVAMARLIDRHGGDCRQTAAAACLAGPAVFSADPVEGLHPRLKALSQEIRDLPDAEGDMHRKIPALSSDARLFLQTSAIMLLEQTAGMLTGRPATLADQEKIYTEALGLYTAARGPVDAYKLDTRFEIAAMKATTVLDAKPYIWNTPSRAPSRVAAHA